MRARLAVTLAAAAAASLTAAAFLTGDNQAARSSVEPGTLLFSSLTPRLADAQRVTITQGGRTLAIERHGEAWGLPDKSYYPIDPERLHALLAALTELRLLEPRTADPAQHARLGLDDPHAAGSTGVLIEVLGKDANAIAAVIKGHGKTGPVQDGTAPETTYVRRPDENQSWLAQGGLAAPIEFTAWVVRDVIDIPHDSVTRIVSSRADGKPLELARKDDKLVVASPADHPALDQFKLDDMARALETLSLSDVRPAAAVPGTLVGRDTITTKAGLTVTATISHAADNTWVRLSARGDGEAASEAAALQARLSGWAFQVEPSKEAALLPKLADLAAYSQQSSAPAVPPAKP